MEDDWDLHAIVRGCLVSSSPPATPPATTEVDSSSSSALDFHPRKDDFILHSSAAAGDDLHEIYKPFFFSNPDSMSQKSISFVSSPLDFTPHHLLHASISRCFSPSSYHHPHSRFHRLKRRKTQTKRVCHMPAEDVSSDEWAWRKYGQKPIKGSPFPRGYYRCSSSKGCTARKQVERNKSDPGMFILTYTGEHNHPAPTHRNSLAGSTRQKPAAQNPATRDDYEDEEVGLHDMMVTEDIFHGLEDLMAGGVVFSDKAVPAAAAMSGMPWLQNKAAIAGEKV